MGKRRFGKSVEYLVLEVGGGLKIDTLDFFSRVFWVKLGSGRVKSSFFYGGWCWKLIFLFVAGRGRGEARVCNLLLENWVILAANWRK